MRGRGRGAVAVLKAAHSFNVPGLPEVRAEEDEWSRFATRCHPATGSALLVGEDHEEDEEEEEEEKEDEGGLGLGLGWAGLGWAGLGWAMVLVTPRAMSRRRKAARS